MREPFQNLRTGMATQQSLAGQNNYGFSKTQNPLNVELDVEKRLQAEVLRLSVRIR